VPRMKPRLPAGRVAHALLPALVTMAVYLPNAFRRSAWSDDYPFLESGDFTKHYADGRPALGLLYEAVFPGNIDDLAVLRVLGVIGIAAVSMLLSCLLMRWGVSPRNAVLWATSVAFLPPFHFYAGWATTFAYPWILLVAALAGFFWIETTQSHRRTLRVAAIGGMTLAMLSYPPAAMFCWVPLGLKILVLRMRPRQAFRAVLRLGCLVVGTGVASLLIAPLARNIRGIPVDSRVQIITSPQEAVEKILWFVSHPVVVAARPFNIRSPEPLNALLTAGPVLGVTAIGLFVALRGPALSRLGTLCALGVCCSLTMTAHLVVPDNQIEYRFMVGLTVLAWGCVCAAFHWLIQRGTEWLPSRLRNIMRLRGTPLPTACFALLLPLVAYLSVTNIRQTFIEPSVSKEDFLLNSLTTYDPSVHDRILIIDHQEIWKSRPNLGTYSTTSDLAHGWVAEPNIRLLLRETGRDHSLPVLKVARDDTPPEAGDYLVDLRPYALSFPG